MMQEDETDINEYHVLTIEKTTPPEGASNDNWHRYVIGKGTSRIEGKTSGSLYEVTRHAEIFVDDLNSRKARGGSMYVYGKQR
jgi:hypothetical protein